MTQQLNGLKAAGDVDTYNRQVPRYNAVVADHNRLADQHNRAIGTHNQLLRSLGSQIDAVAPRERAPSIP